ncbi:MAG: hypothetical protein ACYSOT_07490, partial [Planctomycetota bacterium]
MPIIVCEMKLSTNVFNSIFCPLTSNSTPKLDSCIDLHSIGFALSFQNLIMSLNFIIKASSLSAVRILFRPAQVAYTRTVMKKENTIIQMSK